MSNIIILSDIEKKFSESSIVYYLYEINCTNNNLGIKKKYSQYITKIETNIQFSVFPKFQICKVENFNFEND